MLFYSCNSTIQKERSVLSTKINIDPFSACTIPIFPKFDNEKLSTATGFFWRHEGRVLLITNWHVLSGREPKTGQPKSKDGALPNFIEFHFRIKENLNLVAFVNFSLHDSDGKNVWMQCAKYGQKLDIAFLDLTETINEISKTHNVNSMPTCVNDLYEGLDMKLYLGSDVFITGFPLGLIKTDVFPIWKRGSIATEPHFPVDGLPCFLVDATTKEGMSGAPVLARTFNLVESGGSISLGGGTHTQFLGVYSGRYVGADATEAHLGIVWRAEALEEALKNPTQGDFALSK